MLPALARGVRVAKGSLVTASNMVAVFAVEEAAAGLAARSACVRVCVCVRVRVCACVASEHAHSLLVCEGGLG